MTRTGETGHLRNFALEDAIRRAPDDLDAYEVYADWLIERDEPQGELIPFDVRRRRGGSTNDFDVLAAEARLLRDRRRILENLARFRAPSWNGSSSSASSKRSASML